MSRAGWHLLTHATLTSELESKWKQDNKATTDTLIVLRPNGSCVVGQLREINSLAFKVVNGEIEEIIPFTNQLLMFQFIAPPSERTWKRGESQLGLKLDN